MKKLISFILTLSMILSMLTFTSVFAEAKLIFEESFEGDLSQWREWSTVSAEKNKITDEGYTHGSKSYFSNDDSTTTSVGIESKKIPVTAGETYTLLYDVFVTANSMPVYFRFFDASGNRLHNVQKSTKPSNSWVTEKQSAVAPEGSAYCMILIVTNNAYTCSGYYDNIRLYNGDAAIVNPTNAKNPPVKEAPKTETVVVADNYKDGEVILSESFENGIPETWTVKSTLVVEASEKMAADGKKSLYIEDNSDTLAGGLASPFIAVSEGNTYSAAVDSYAIHAGIPLYIKFFDGNKKEVASASVNNGVVNEWNHFSTSQTAPKGAVYAQVWLHTVKASIQIGYIDNVKFIKGVYRAPVIEKPYIAPKQVAPVNAQLVAPVDNKLVYSEYNEYGDKIGDFSYAGFYKGEYELPNIANLPVVLEISPTGTDDDTEMLQAAIDKVYSEATDDRMKVIKLKAGTYNINKKGILIKSGIVLLGEGQGPTGTILYAKDPVQYIPVKVTGASPARIGTLANITDEYIKAGTKTINISEEDVKNFKVGDLITVYQPSTNELSNAIGMQGIINVYNNDTSWKAGDFDSKSERIITAINGTEITLDYSLFLPAKKSLTQCYIYKTDNSGKVKNVGIENLRIVSYYNGSPTDESHATTAISISNAENVYVRNVSSKYFYMSLVASSTNSKQITVSGCSSLEPVSTLAGSRRYSFAASTSAEQVLYTGNYSFDGRHDFETSLTVTGPIAYVDNVIDSSNTASETHGTWSTGVLFDNLYQINNGSKGFFAMANRGIYGTAKSQGWSAASSIMWNCLGTTMIAHKLPETYQTFMVGTWGIYTDKVSETMKANNIASYKNIYRTKDQYTYEESNFATKEGTPMVGDAYKEGEFTPVEPRSLYKAQLSERFTGVISNARPNAPVIVYPKSDKVTDDKAVTISGLYQLGAEKVTLYIDDASYNATLKPETNEFEFTITLEEGVHKIYATQTFAGVEGVKNADRFITIGKENGNPTYLQSIYDVSKTTLLINDPRPTYDVYEKSVSDELASKITVMIGGSVLQSDVDPFIENGRTLVPMRAIFEAIGATVEWDAATETATSKKDGTEVKITKNNTTAYVNGTPVTLDVPAAIYDGRFMVPVRFISESFGCEVGWNGLRKIVTIKMLGLRFPACHALANELDIYDLIQSGDDGAGSIIDNTADGDFSTGWGVAFDESKPDGAYGIIDLGSSKEITDIYIAFHAGNKRVYEFDLYVSDDKENYTLVSQATKSSGTTLDFESYPINAKGRYVKIVGKGNSVNYWMNIKEFALTGK